MTTRASVLMMPLSTLYRAITGARAAAYRGGIFKTARLAAPVISIGNITAGGTGKTPLVEWVCRAILRADSEKRVCVLTRGYGKKDPCQQVVASTGHDVVADEHDAGDEPFLLATNLFGVAAVISNPDRVEAGNWAIENLGSNVFVLDDGFQHLRLSRDLDIVAVDATNPFGGGELLPTGRLREIPTALARADCIVLTRCDQASSLPELIREVRGLAGERPILTSRMTLARFRLANGSPAEPNDVRGLDLAAFCGIGNPRSFFELLTRANLTVALTRRFADHHRYSQADVDKLVAEARQAGAGALITTAKDAVKLGALTIDFPVYVAEIKIEIDDEARLEALLQAVLSQDR